MSLRKIIATAALIGGMGGVGVIMADTSLVIGSTSDAGVMTICANPATCSPGGPIHVIGNPTSPTSTGPAH